MNEVREQLAHVAPDGWIVGGAVRDRLLGRATADLDIAVDGDPEAVARGLARRVRAHAFRLSEEFGAWRVVSRRDGWQLDVLPLGGSLEEDLAARDLTVNAIAEPVRGGEPVDPFEGRRDLEARILRAVSDQSFVRDPLRTLRTVRLACELGFEVEPGTQRLAAESAPALAGVAPERVFGELRRLICSPRAVPGVLMMDELGLTQAVLPELHDLRGVEQNRYHHLDVHGHTLEVLEAAIALADDPARWFPSCAGRLRLVLDEELADGLTRGQALRFGALFHDMAKPLTRGRRPDGRVTFIGHDAAGAEMALSALTRLRASHRLGDHVAGLTRHHLRLGFLVHRVPLSRRDLYAYLAACGPVGVDVTLLSTADRLATRGHGSEPAIAKHLALAREVMGAALDWREAPPRAPVRGDEIASALGLRPGPAMGRLLEALAEASYTGEIGGREDALELAARILDDERAR